MHYCTSCQKAISTIQIVDLAAGDIVGQQFLCSACAEQAGHLQSKAAVQLTPQVIEDLFGGGVLGRTGRRSKRGHACPGCGLTLEDFKRRGRLGCARCYEDFRADLVPLLERVHDATSHRGRYPTRRAATPADDNRRQVEDLHRRLADAVQGERYEEAAELRDQLRRAGEREANRD